MTKLAGSLTLILAFCVAAFADDINTPPCIPGDINTPPCSTAQLTTDDPTNPGDMSTPPAAETIVITTMVDAAVGALLSIW